MFQIMCSTDWLNPFDSDVFKFVDIFEQIYEETKCSKKRNTYQIKIKKSNPFEFELVCESSTSSTSQTTHKHQQVQHLKQLTNINNSNNSRVNISQTSTSLNKSINSHVNISQASTSSTSLNNSNISQASTKLNKQLTKRITTSSNVFVFAVWNDWINNKWTAV